MGQRVKGKRYSFHSESAGSLSVALHIMSPLSNGLQSETAIDLNWGPINPADALDYDNMDMFILELSCENEEDVLGKGVADDRQVFCKVINMAWMPVHGMDACT